jgi:anti-sigma regulatory factor (Ser/Thr protein kinase)
MSTPSFTVSLRDYVDVVELRMRATMLASACGLGRRRQGLVAVAVTEAGVFALQHVGRSAAELRVENDETSSRLMVVVRGAGSVVGLAESLLPALGEDGGLVLAERAAERFSVSTEPKSGTKVTMAWALPSGGRTVGKDEPLESGDEIDAVSSQLDALHDEHREFAVLSFDPRLSMTPERADRARAEEDAGRRLADKEITSAQDRLAHDLRDVVMGRLFDCGLLLRNTLMLDHRFEVVNKVEEIIDELEANVADLSQARNPPDPTGSVRQLPPAGRHRSGVRAES